MTWAAASWRQQLEAWVIPSALLATVTESPYGWPEALWRRRAHSAVERGEVTPTTTRVEELAGRDGDILDVGAGTGRASLPLARSGHAVTAVERSESMLKGLRDLSEGLPVRVVEGSWPEVADGVEPHAVGMCAHVVYDVPDLAPFLLALHQRAESGVVVELTATHPWTHLGPYYRSLHNLDRPSGPTVADFTAVVEEVVGVAPVVESWMRPPDLWFESREEILELYGRRLLVTEARWPELDALLGPEIEEHQGRYRFGADQRQFSTVWWER